MTNSHSLREAVEVEAAASQVEVGDLAAEGERVDVPKGEAEVAIAVVEDHPHAVAEDHHHAEVEDHHHAEVADLTRAAVAACVALLVEQFVRPRGAASGQM